MVGMLMSDVDDRQRLFSRLFFAVSQFGSNRAVGPRIRQPGIDGVADAEIDKKAGVKLPRRVLSPDIFMQKLQYSVAQ